MGRDPTTYWDYIKTDQLLSLQNGLDATDAGLANDEVLFITVHQIDELWFKLILRELVGVRDCLKQDPVPEVALASAVRSLRRTAVLFQSVARHFELMETITTRDYLAFRDKLSPASGFQSAQLREIEMVLGLDDAQRIPLGHETSYMEALRNPDGTPSLAFSRVETRRADTPTIKGALAAWLYRTPVEGSKPDEPGDAASVSQFTEDYLAALDGELRGIEELAIAQSAGADVERLARRYAAERESARAFLTAADISEEQRPYVARIRAALVFIESYRELPLLAWPRELVDAVVALEQASLVFRQRHARMVERVIGRRTGTGGSAGVDYLDETALRYRVFTDVWAVRTLLLRRAALPPLRNAEFYGFAGTPGTDDSHSRSGT